MKNLRVSSHAKATRHDRSYLVSYHHIMATNQRLYCGLEALVIGYIFFRGIVSKSYATICGQISSLDIE